MSAVLKHVPGTRAGRQFLSGNEAVARGAWEAGVELAAAYPGTPSTEILESLATLPGVYAEWSSNEKVALEVALGASISGRRAITAMKHVGVNVAADSLMTMGLVGAKAGLVIAVSDDIGFSSSQNEQDNRRYAVAAGLPMISPADPQEAYDFFFDAVELPERWKLPVLFRMTTRVCHSKSLVRARGAPLPAPASHCPRREARRGALR